LLHHLCSSLSMEFTIARKSPENVQCVTSEPYLIPENSVLVNVDKFSFTTTNVHYANNGDISHFNHFPTADAESAIVPVRGVGTVVVTRCDGVEEGVRIYGMFPMASYVTMTPEDLTATGFKDGTKCRLELPDEYRRYEFLPATPDPREDLTISLTHHWRTCCAIDDFMQKNKDFLAKAFIISSASSKLAIGLAHMLSKRGFQVYGITSQTKFAGNLGVYNKLVTYQNIRQLPRIRTVFLDLAGEDQCTHDVHALLIQTQGMAYSMKIGKTHWSVDPAKVSIQGTPPVDFDTVDYYEKLGDDAAALESKVKETLPGFLEFCEGCTTVKQRRGAKAAGTGYTNIREGKVEPSDVPIYSLWG